MEADHNDELEQLDLVQALVLEAGRLMENASMQFAMQLPRELTARRAVLAWMAQTVQTIEALVYAATELERLNRGE